MKRAGMRIGGIAGAASCLLGLLFAAYAGDEFTIRHEVRLVLLDVSVKDRDGNLVPGLARQDFSVYEDGRQQIVSVFDNQDAPVTMGVLVDESASMTPRRGQVLAAAEDLIKESNRDDEVFVLNFNDAVTRGLPDGVLFSAKIPQLRAALYRGHPAGQTALYDAVTDGLKQLEEGKRARKTLVLVSDGGDNASLHKRAETIDLAEGSAATIFAIGLFDPDAYDADPGILRRFAKISGGGAWFPENLESVDQVCRLIAKEIRTRYTIGYVPRSETASAQLRHIRVKISAPGRQGLTASTREVYRYEASKIQ